MLQFYYGNYTLREGDEIEKELRAAHNDCELDVNPYVNIYDTRNLSGYSNADTIAVYNLDVVSAKARYYDQYPRCIGVYLRKANHPALLLKILLTEDAYTKKDEYLKTLFDNIDFPHKWSILKYIEHQLTGFYTDLCFPPETNNSHPIMDELPLQIPKN